MRFPTFWLVFAGLLFAPFWVLSQGRSIFNSDFENPDVTSVTPPRVIGTVGSWGGYFNGNVPFWRTSAADSLIEIGLAGTYGAAPAPSGAQIAELNANMAGNLFLDVCLFAGENITYSLWHRGRAGTDVMGLVITNPLGVNLPEVFYTTNNTAWVNYTGSFNNTTGIDGNVRFTFRAVSTATGNLTVGNLIDNVTIDGLSPLVEFNSATYSNLEPGTNTPQVRMNGVVPSGGATLTFNITGGTATLGTDFAITSTLNIPAGNYFNTLFNIPFAVVDDALTEADETVNITLVSATANTVGQLSPLIRNTSCGPSPIATTVYTILDNDPLPIEQLILEAEDQCSHVALTARVVGSFAGEDFWFERSTDLNNWTALPGIAATTGTGFALADATPTADNYYRAGWIDLDGTIRYSTVAYAPCACVNEADVQVFPVPARGQNITLRQFATEGPLTISLTDAQGRAVLRHPVIASQNGLLTVELPTANLPAGLYLLSSSQAGRSFTRKLIVQ
jgi:hypothetical protein